MAAMTEVNAFVDSGEASRCFIYVPHSRFGWLRAAVNVDLRTMTMFYKVLRGIDLFKLESKIDIKFW